MSHYKHFHIKVDKDSDICQFLLGMKEACIEQFGEDIRKIINENLLLNLIAEYIAQHGIKQTEQYLDELKIHARKAHQRTLH